MKLGIALDYAKPRIDVELDRVLAAERLGYDTVWSAEIYGSDAVTPLAFLAAKTERIRLGTGVMQLAARTPANAAMSMATLDQLAGGGRVIAGLGVSGPQIVEGWYGRPWGSPINQLRDYVTIVKKMLARETVSHDGRAISLPYAGEGSTGQGKPLKLILHPDVEIPVFLGCGGPASVALMAELCDGWLPMGLTPDNWETYRPAIEKGLARAEGSKSIADLEIHGGVQVVLTDDVEAALAREKPGVAFRVGGYGSSTHNFHKESMVRRGYGDAAERIQELFLAGKRDDAAAAVPDAYLDDSGLYGDETRIRERYQRYVDAHFTTLTVRGSGIDVLEMMADVAGLDPASDQPSI